jgi:protein TonB
MVGNSQVRVAFDNPQPRRLFVALLVLLVALVGLMLKDQGIWFSSDQSMLDSDAPAVASKTAETTAETSTPAATSQAHSSATPVAKKRLLSAKPATVPTTEAASADVPIVASNRTALAPLDIQVVPGDGQSTTRPIAPVENTHPETSAPALPVAALATATNAAERQQMSINAVRPRSTYPVLAQHMNVQGSVVLQAVIGADGIIEDLHVLSGPAILTSAAQQAVREWHFKPLLQNGRPVESKARITVNFTIKVADNVVKEQPGL